MNWIDRVNACILRRLNLKTNSWTTGGLLGESRGGSVNISWDDIERIYACKRDIHATDQVYLVFFSAQSAVALTEDCNDFDGLCSFIENRFGIPFQWRMQITFAPTEATAPLLIYPSSSKRSTNAFE